MLNRGFPPALLFEERPQDLFALVLFRKGTHVQKGVKNESFDPDDKAGIRTGLAINQPGSASVAARANSTAIKTTVTRAVRVSRTRAQRNPSVAPAHTRARHREVSPFVPGPVNAYWVLSQLPLCRPYSAYSGCSAIGSAPRIRIF